MGRIRHEFGTELVTKCPRADAGRGREGTSDRIGPTSNGQWRRAITKDQSQLEPHNNKDSTSIVQRSTFIIPEDKGCSTGRKEARKIEALMTLELALGPFALQLTNQIRDRAGS